MGYFVTLQKLDISINLLNFCLLIFTYEFVFYFDEVFCIELSKTLFKLLRESFS
jgi:hypothetical protein